MNILQLLTLWTGFTYLHQLGHHKLGHQYNVMYIFQRLCLDIIYDTTMVTQGI